MFLLNEPERSGTDLLVASHHLDEYPDIPIRVRKIWDRTYMQEPIATVLGTSVAINAFFAICDQGWGFKDQRELDTLYRGGADIWCYTIWDPSYSGSGEQPFKDFRRLYTYIKEQLEHVGGDDSYFDYFPGLLDFFGDITAAADLAYPGHNYHSLWQHAIEYCYFKRYHELEPGTIVPDHMIEDLERRMTDLNNGSKIR